MKTALVALFLIAISGATVWYKRESVAGLPPLRTAAVERGEMLYTINATGTVEPEEVVDVGAQVAGKIYNLGADPRNPKKSIDYRSPVDEGTVLARIDDSLYQSEVDRAKAQVDSAKALSASAAAQVLDSEANVLRAKKDLLQMGARLYQARRDWERAQNLWKSSRDAITESDYDLANSTFQAADATVGVGNAAISQAEAQVAISKAAVAKSQADLIDAQANLKRAETNLGYCTIKSPVKGVIIDRRVNIGQTVVSSLNSPSLFLIAKDVQRLQVWASVNEADIGSIHPGQTVRFTIDAFPDRTFEGVVAPDNPRWNATMNQNVVTYTVVVDTDNSDGQLFPYLTASLDFEVARHKDVLLVPNAALRWRPSAARLAAQKAGAGVAGSPGAGVTPTASAAAPKPSAESAAESRTQGTLWIEEGDKIQPVDVRVVLSDGTHTEVEAAGLQEGARVIVGEAASASESETSDPFSPKMFSGRRPQQ